MNDPLHSLQRFLGELLSGLLAAMGQVVLTLLAVAGTITLMIAATMAFGTTGLMLVAAPLCIGLFIWAVMRAGGEGSGSGDE
ncbi:MAG: hypothetical protein SF172_03335 [Burkholderiales bacterium]|nr:hypothetical protein [Burkholderiales bacterium]